MDEEKGKGREEDLVMDGGQGKSTQDGEDGNGEDKVIDEGNGEHGEDVQDPDGSLKNFAESKAELEKLQPKS